MTRRKRYSISQRLSMARMLQTRSDNGESLRSIARDLEVDPSQLRRWRSQIPQFEESLTPRHGTSVNAGAGSTHRGRKSILHEVEDKLLEYIWEQREQGLPVSIRMVTAKASQLHASFRHKTARAKDHAVRRFVASHGIVHRVHTHRSQESHMDVQTKANMV
ncbi:transposase [Nitzschia inconspicua]|uniref:Transposase n=1 Tax=Nitzschia inconspicua TaxID=303405 RepID=A0A9K3KMR5_9STRA|nr:transposase [Nitzschia inconspicua]